MAQQETQDQILLRTSFFGGFKKGEVLSYIDRLREQNRAMAIEFEGRIEGATYARNELTEQVNGLGSKISEMERQLDASSGRVRELTRMVESLKGMLSKQQKYSESQDRELKTQKEQTRQLSLRAQNYEYKAKRYEELSEQVGNILLKTRQDADHLLGQAEQEAQGIKSTAIFASEKIFGEMRLMRGELATVRGYISQLMSSINGRLEEIDQMLLQADPMQSKNEREQLSLSELSDAKRAEAGTLSAIILSNRGEQAFVDSEIRSKQFFRDTANV